MDGQQGSSLGDVAAEAADRGNELRDGVLPGHRVIEHGRVHGTPALAGKDPGFGDDLEHGLHDPVGTFAGGQALAPIRERGGMERGLGEPETAGRLPPQVKGQSLRRPAVRQALQDLEDQDRADHRSRNRRPAAAHREQVFHHRVRKQPLPVLGQKREGTARSQQLPGQCLHIQQPALGLLKSLHSSSLNDHGPKRRRRALNLENCSAVS